MSSGLLPGISWEHHITYHQPRKRSKFKVQLLLSTYRFCAFVKSKHSKMNHCKSGTIWDSLKRQGQHGIGNGGEKDKKDVLTASAGKHVGSETWLDENPAMHSAQGYRLGCTGLEVANFSSSDYKWHDCLFDVFHSRQDNSLLEKSEDRCEPVDGHTARIIIELLLRLEGITWLLPW